MSYLKKIEQDYNDGLTSFTKFTNLKEEYSSSTIEEKKELEDKSSEILEEINSVQNLHLKDINVNTKSIKNNVQFFFWFFIITSLTSLIFIILS